MKTTSPETKNYEVRIRSERKTRNEIYLEKMVMKWVWPFINVTISLKLSFDTITNMHFGAVSVMSVLSNTQSCCGSNGQWPSSEIAKLREKQRKEAFSVEVAEFLVHWFHIDSFSFFRPLNSVLRTYTLGEGEGERFRIFVFISEIFRWQFYHCNKEREKSDIDDESRTQNTREKNAQ